MQQHSLCKLAVVHVALKPKSLSHLSSAKSVAATIDKGWFGRPCCNTEASKACQAAQDKHTLFQMRDWV